MILSLLVPSVLAAPILSAPSLLPGDDTVGPAAGNQWNAVLVEGDGDYLLVWEDTRATLAGTLGNLASAGGPDLYAIRLDADGVPLDTVPFPIASGPWLESAPRAAYSDGQWLVAYDADDETTWYYSQGVYAKRIDAASAEVLDSDPIVLVNDEAQEEWLHDVAGDGTGFAVLWQEADGATFVLEGATIDAAGTSSGPLRIYTPTFNTYAPWNARLAWNTDRYLIAWDAWGTSSTSDIEGMLVDEDLDPLTSVLEISAGGSTDFTPAVAAGDDGFYVAWQDDGVGSYWGEIQGTPVSIDGVPEVSGGENLSDTMYPAYANPEVAWMGDQWSVAWGQSGAFASLVDTDGALAEIVDVSGSDTSIARVTTADSPEAVTAWDAATTLSGWSFGYEVETSSVLDAGSAGTVASLGAPAQTHPDVAGDAGGYLLVAQSQTGTSARIVAWTLDRRGVPTGTRPVSIATGTGEIQDPAVAWNGSEYLVVWEEYNTGGTSSQIWGKRVSRMGRVLDASPIAIVPGNDPAVAASGTDFLVVSSYEVRHEEREIDAVRVADDGSVLDSTPLVLGVYFSTLPDVTGTGTGWVAAWQHASTHDSPYHTVRVASVSSAGAKTSEQTVYSAGSTALQVDASVASDGTSALVTWSDDGDVLGRFVSSAGVPTGTGITINDEANDQFETAVAWNGTAYQVAWTDWRIHSLVESGEGDVYTTTVTTTGTVANAIGLAVSADTEVPEGNPAVAGVNGTSIFGWTALHEESPYAAFRVETAALTRSRP